MELGSKLKSGRQGAGLSLREVERLTGISNGYLSQLESDHVKQPSPHHLYRLAEVYGLSYADLLAASGYALPNDPGSVPMRHQGLAAAVGELTEDEAQRVDEYIQLLRSARRGRVGSER